MNKLIIKKEREQTKTMKRKKFGLEMALAKLATVRNTLSINQLLEHREEKTNEKR